MKNYGLNINDVKNFIPCSLEAIDHLDEIFLEGKNKLLSELNSAIKIPEHRRRLIN
jgi:hypothetical protein